jgi:hypothetical protein
MTAPAIADTAAGLTSCVIVGFTRDSLRLIKSKAAGE